MRDDALSLPLNLKRGLLFYMQRYKKLYFLHTLRWKTNASVRYCIWNQLNNLPRHRDKERLLVGGKGE